MHLCVCIIYLQMFVMEYRYKILKCIENEQPTYYRLEFRNPNAGT